MKNNFYKNYFIIILLFSFYKSSICQKIVAGASFNAVICNNNKIYNWGVNNSYELGDTSSVNKYFPQEIRWLTNVDRINSTMSSTFAIRDDSTVWAWGVGYFGDRIASYIRYPTKINTLYKVKDVVGNIIFSIALNYDGTILTWGRNNKGQLGNGTYNDSILPELVPGLNNVKDFTIGEDFTLVLKNDSTIWAWGDNGIGQIGQGTTTWFYNVPTIITGINKIVDVYSSVQTVYALESDGTFWAWGNNSEGQYGNGNTTLSYVPVKNTTINNIKKLAPQQLSVICLKNDGTVWSWGYNGQGELGNGTLTSSYIPAQIPGLSNIIDIKSGVSHTIALKDDGTVWTWGNNKFGEIGDGLYNTYQITPKQVTLPCSVLSNLSNISDNDKLIHVYPNPTQEILYVSSDIDIDKYELFDIFGNRIIQNKNINNQIDVSSISKGIYFVRLYFKDSMITKKLNKL